MPICQAQYQEVLPREAFPLLRLSSLANSNITFTKWRLNPKPWGAWCSKSINLDPDPLNSLGEARGQSLQESCQGQNLPRC